MSKPMEFTGERYTPECVREIRYEHLHRYAFAAEWVGGRDVLDAACGEGYGSHLLSARARTVTGVDIAREAVEHARQRYRSERLSFRVEDCCDLPFEDDSFGAVVSFETLEHLESQERLLREFRRVLAEDGFLIISSPDKAIYTDRMKNRNPFHVRELYRPELERLLATEFPAVRLLGQRLAFHSQIWPVDGAPPDGFEVHRERDDRIERLEGPGGDAMYFIAICAASREALPPLQAGLWLFDDAVESVYRHYHHEIGKNMEAGAVLEQREREIELLRAQLESCSAGGSTSSPVNDGSREQTGRAPWWRRWFGRR
ncbi:class I SAM-dependent methyltransferase [Elongatibacter sediminis]|uniref:Class I SAM-dependent methyltransferase n=1 Tax=Elongatibacter sediminis TaxID=3119006 RepID=A0AAW9RFK6_9GAMM